MPAGATPIGGPDPLKPWELRGKQVEVKKGEASLQLSPYELRKQKAEAQKAEIDATTAQEAYNAAHPKGTGATVVGPDSLKNLSVPDQELVKALAEGRLAFPGGFALKAPWWQQKLEQVAQYDPTFDATNYNNRAKARASLISGKVGTSANALNTAIGHAGLLNGQIPGTASHNFTPINAIENAFDQHVLGQPGITNYKDTAGKLASEETSVYRNGGGAEADVERYLKSFDPNAAEKQKRDVVRNTLDLFASKQAANLYQFNLSSGGKPAVDLLDAQARKVLDQFPDIRDKYFAQPSAPLSREAAALIQANGGTPPPSGPAAPPPGDPNAPPPVGPQGSPPRTDYSGMVGGAQQALATGGYRTAFDPVGAAALSALIKHGAPYETAAAYAQSHGFNPPPQDAYMQAVAFQKSHPQAAPNVEADRTVPTTFGERVSASPLAAGIAGGVTGATAGLSDVAGRTVAGPAWDANRAALAATNPGADLAGNVAGGIGGMMGGSSALGKLAPGLIDAARASRVAPFLPAAGDAAYSAAYGASESPNDPLGGAAKGLAVGVPGGMFARGVVRGAGKAIAPTGGNLAPLFEANSQFRPSIGQALSASDSRFSRALGMGEQAAESIPALGGIQTASRTAATDQMQRGAFNHALGELAPLNPVVGSDISQLPQGVVKGPQAHQFMQDSFNTAYDHARSNMQFVADPQYGQDLGAWQRSQNAMALTDAQAQHVQKTITQALKGRVQGNAMDGNNYRAAASDLSGVARTWASRPETSGQAAYLRDFVSIMDDAAKRASPPEAGAMLDAANKGYAKAAIVENAAKSAGGEPTEFTGKNLLRAVQNSDPSVRDRGFLRGQGLMQDYATAASKLSPSLADSGTPQRLAWMRLGGSGEAAALGGLAAAGHPLALAPWAIDTLANMPGVRDAVGALLAPRSNETANIIGTGLKKRANTIGMFGAPAALGYFGGQ